MNIFYLDNRPKVAAQYHCDKHVVKMILESAQMLCTAHRLTGSDDDTLYKATHKNHPSTKWVRQNKENYIWLYNLFVELCDEYTYRYNKVHLTDQKFREALRKIPNIPDGDFTEPPMCMPDVYKIGDTIHSYRNYYLKVKAPLFKWTNREQPYWV